MKEIKETTRSDPQIIPFGYLNTGDIFIMIGVDIYRGGIYMKIDTSNGIAAKAGTTVHNAVNLQTGLAYTFSQLDSVHIADLSIEYSLKKNIH